MNGESNFEDSDYLGDLKATKSCVILHLGCKVKGGVEDLSCHSYILMFLQVSGTIFWKLLIHWRVKSWDFFIC